MLRDERLGLSNPQMMKAVLIKAAMAEICGMATCSEIMSLVLLSYLIYIFYYSRHAFAIHYFVGMKNHDVCKMAL